MTLSAARNQPLRDWPSLAKSDALAFLRASPLGAISTVSEDGSPEVAVVNLAVTDDL